jgi:ERCC4-type nuclease
MKLVIDYREKKLIQLVESIKLMNAKYKPIEVIVENLPLSDIIIKDKHDRELILIERKSINDLASSIQDGRYNEQSYRLNNTDIHNHNIIYLIEGNLAMWNNRYSRITQDTIYSAMVSLMYYKGFSVFRTYTLVETAEFALNMALKINKSSKLSPPKRPYFQNINFRNQPNSTSSSDSEDQPNSISSSATSNAKINIKLNPNVVESTKHETVETTPSLKYSKYVKREKKSNITPENIDVIMLSQIPHVSVDTAMQILSRHGTIYKLINTLKETPDALKTFMVKTKSGTRKLSSKTVSNIKTFLTIEK